MAPQLLCVSHSTSNDLATLVAVSLGIDTHLQIFCLSDLKPQAPFLCAVLRRQKAVLSFRCCLLFRPVAWYPCENSTARICWPPQGHAVLRCLGPGGPGFLSCSLPSSSGNPQGWGSPALLLCGSLIWRWEVAALRNCGPAFGASNVIWDMINMALVGITSAFKISVRFMMIFKGNF